MEGWILRCVLSCPLNRYHDESWNADQLTPCERIAEPSTGIFQSELIFQVRDTLFIQEGAFEIQRIESF